MSRMEMMFSWLKYLNNFISRSVRKQNMEWSKGVIFLIATFCPDGLWSAELPRCQRVKTTAGCAVCNLPDNAVSALTNYILNVVLFGYIEGDLPGATAPSRRARHVDGFVGVLDVSVRVCVRVRVPEDDSIRDWVEAGAVEHRWRSKGVVECSDS